MRAPRAQLLLLAAALLGAGAGASAGWNVPSILFHDKQTPYEPLGGSLRGAQSARVRRCAGAHRRECASRAVRARCREERAARRTRVGAAGSIRHVPEYDCVLA